MRQAYVYVMTNKPMGVLYIGVTADLPARIYAHRSGTGSEFCKRWSLVHLVYAEPFDRIDEAIIREKSLKKWNRVWKLRLISETNPEGSICLKASTPEQCRQRPPPARGRRSP